MPRPMLVLIERLAAQHWPNPAPSQVVVIYQCRHIAARGHDADAT